MMQDIETKDTPIIYPAMKNAYEINIPSDSKITLPRVKWLEDKPNRIFYGTEETMGMEYYSVNHRYNNKIKHLSLLDRLKRMFKR